MDPDPELMNIHWLSILVLTFFPVFSIQFNVYVFLSVPAYYFNTDPDPDPRSQTNADPCRSESGSLSVVRLESHKNLNFKLKSILTVKNMSKTYYKGTKAFLKGRKPCYFIILVNFDAAGSGSAFQIRIRIHDIQKNADPDPQHWFLYLLLILISVLVFIQNR